MGKYTKAEEDYLEAIYMLGGADGGVQSVAVSVKLGVSKPAVNMATNDLAKKGLIEKQRYGDLTLTKEGNGGKRLLQNRAHSQRGNGGKTARAERKARLLKNAIKTRRALTERGFSY